MTDSTAVIGRQRSENGNPSHGTTVARQGPAMSQPAKRAVGLWLLCLGVGALGHLLWAWALATRLDAAAGTASRIRAHWLWLAFTPTPQFGRLLVVVLTALCGSVATMALIFGNRAGHRKLEEDWEWWYLLRPMSAAAIGVLAYVVVIAGFLGTTDSGDGKLAVAAAIGALAGLFTDRVLAAMRSALGASAFNVSASTPAEAKKTGGTDAVGETAVSGNGVAA